MTLVRTAFCLVICSFLLDVSNNGGRFTVMAQSEEDVIVEDDDIDSSNVMDDEESVNEEEDFSFKNSSPDANTIVIFTKPAITPGFNTLELRAGQVSEFLVGFSNIGSSDFIVKSLEASLRYPQDFSYHIQNYSHISLEDIVKPNEEATLKYAFIPSDAFAGRAMGLTIDLSYTDADGKTFNDAVFNETIQIIEFDVGFDTEVFFMWVFLTFCGILIVFLIYSFSNLANKKKRKPTMNKQEDYGANLDDGVDYEWIPSSSLHSKSYGIGGSNTSPRQRKNRKNAHGTSDTE